MRAVYVSLFAAVALAAAGCPKAPDKGTQPPPRDLPAVKPHDGPTDADKRKQEALERASAIDAALAGYARQERLTDSPPRKLELWRDGKLPTKLRISDIAPDQKVAHVTDFYYTNGRLTYVRHEQGLFMFDGDSLALMLDPVTQQIKRGVKPEQAIKIGDDLRNTSTTELNAFR